MRIILYALLATVLGGCNRMDLGKYELLGDLRVIAIKSEPPEVAPGAAVVLTPLLNDLNGAGRALTYSVEACVDPGLDLGAEPTCAGRPDRVSLIENAAVSGLSAPNYVGTAPVINVTVPLTVFLGRSTRDQHNGIAYLVFYQLKDNAGTSFLTAFKKIIVSTRTIKNTSPILTGVQVNGAAPGALPTAVAALTPQFTGDPRESFAFLDLSGTSANFSEEIVTSWFTTDGAFDKNRTGYVDPSQWTPPSPAPEGRQVILIAVSRDRRGGESFQILQF